MRVKTYCAPTVREAMARIRRDLGEEAVIVSVREGGPNIDAMVTAAIDSVAPPSGAHETGQEPEPGGDPFDVLADTLSHHRVPAHLADALRADAGIIESDKPLVVLAGALDMNFGFAPLEQAGGNRLLMVGPPGSGKTVTCAKIAAACALQNRPVRLISTDTERPGAWQRLAALSEILNLPVSPAGRRRDIENLIAEDPNILTLIDTPGINPLDGEDLDRLNALADMDSLTPILVMAAGGEPLDSAEHATLFAPLGVRRLLATRLDTTRRYGSLLSAAHAGRLSFAAATFGPAIGGGFASLNPMSLARLMIAPDTAGPLGNDSGEKDRSMMEVLP